jgi:two-component system sensor histidine kinase RegB
MKDTISQNINRKNLLQLLFLRLIAIFGQVATIIFAYYFLNIALPLSAMFSILILLFIVNCISFYRYKFQENISDKSLFIELLFDVTALTSQLYFSGGISNPFISLFLLQVIIGAILLQRIYAWLIASITTICYVWLSSNYRELHAFHHQKEGDLFNLHLHGMLISYVFAAILLLIFVSKIIKNLREGDEKINLLNRQSLEKEQVIRMGLLATGAAHELGTPLSTILVILGDWKEMNLRKDLLEDVKVIEAQITRCKKILSEILIDSGKERLEKATIAMAKEVFDNLIVLWTESRKPVKLIYNFEGKHDKKILLDDILTQAFFNIFDNALEESPNFISVKVLVTNDNISVNVEDRGKGFDPEIIKQIGKPNLTTKNSSGLGLFLALNILHRIGGDLKIENLSTGGAKVSVTLSLKNL